MYYMYYTPDTSGLQLRVAFELCPVGRKSPHTGSNIYRGSGFAQWVQIWFDYGDGAFFSRDWGIWEPSLVK